MAYTVEGSFLAFYEAINLSGDHREIANKRKDRVVDLLAKSFTIQEAFATGSIPKFTALKSHADVDVMVALHFGKHIENRSPQSVLQSVRDALGEYKTGVRRNGQAVTLSYDTWPDVDIVPVSRSIDAVGKVTHYNVPNSNTGLWMPSRPKEFAQVIDAKATTCGPNFRRIVKMIKSWNRVHSDFLQSYHIEVLAVRSFGDDLSDTQWKIYQFFQNSRKLLEAGLWYDLGYVDNYLSYSDRQEVLKRFDTAIEKSRAAWHLTYGTNSDHRGAIAIWKQMFGDKFPAYG